MTRERLFVIWCFLLEARVLTRGLVGMGRNFNTQAANISRPRFLWGVALTTNPI
jgi:hypothetical protein